MLVGTRRTIALILSLHQGLLGLALSLHHLERAAYLTCHLLCIISLPVMEHLLCIVIDKIAYFASL